MVPTFSIVFMIFSGLVAFGLPVLVFIIINKRIKLSVIPALVGCAAFVVFALVLERILHSFVLYTQADGSITLIEKSPILYVLYGIFAAGIFEETARFISFSLLKKRHHGIGTGLSYGIGHGGIECILIVGLTMVNNVIFSIMINTGSLALLGDTIPAEIIVDPLVNTAPVMFLFGGIERIFAFTFHVAASVVVWTAVNYKGMLWLYPVAICMHAILNIPAAAMQAGLIDSIVLVEVLTAVGAGIAVLIAVFITKKMSERDNPSLNIV